MLKYGADVHKVTFLNHTFSFCHTSDWGTGLREVPSVRIFKVGDEWYCWCKIYCCTFDQEVSAQRETPQEALFELEGRLMECLDRLIVEGANNLVQVRETIELMLMDRA